MADLTDFAKRKCHLNMCKPSKVVANKVCICTYFLHVLVQDRELHLALQATIEWNCY